MVGSLENPLYISCQEILCFDFMQQYDVNFHGLKSPPTSGWGEAWQCVSGQGACWQDSTDPGWESKQKTIVELSQIFQKTESSGFVASGNELKIQTVFPQLLLATKTPADRKEKMWSQIESEMCLQVISLILVFSRSAWASRFYLFCEFIDHLYLVIFPEEQDHCPDVQDKTGSTTLDKKDKKI